METQKMLFSVIICLFLSTPINAQNRAELLRYKDRFLQQVNSEQGYSYSYYEIIEKKDLPKKVKLDLHGGNEYMLVVHGLDTQTQRLKGTPNHSSTDSPVVDVEGYICSQWVDLTKVSSPVSYTFSIDADKLEKSKQEKKSNDFISGLGLENNDELNPMVMFLVIYKSKDNKRDATGNKEENYYTHQKELKTYNKTTHNSYTSATVDELEAELEKITSISPSGLKYMNGRIAVDKWMEAIVQMSYGDEYKDSMYEAMDQDWQKQYNAYKTSSIPSPLIGKTDGGFSHKGFNADNLLVVDHIINDTIVTRYYFKIKKCDDYGRIVPKQEVRDGKLYYTPWQKAVVPKS